jgi:hypothetical protein
MPVLLANCEPFPYFSGNQTAETDSLRISHAAHRAPQHSRVGICPENCHFLKATRETQVIAHDRRGTRRLFRHLALDTLDSSSL